MTRKHTLLVALPVGLVFSLAVLSAPAQQPGLDQPRAKSDARAKSSDEARPQAAAEVSGRVVETKRVPFGTTGARHLIATVETVGGKIRTVNLGPASGPGSVSVEKGDSITMTGQARPVAVVRRAEMFFASQLRTGDQTVTIDRPARPQPELQRVSGRVVRSKQVDWRGGERRELVVLLRTADGKDVIADLGPTIGVKDGGVRTGKDVSLRGRFAQVGDFRVFFATQATCGDKTVTIRREQPVVSSTSLKPNIGRPDAGKPGDEKPAGGETVSLTGTVQGTKEATLKSGGKNLVVLVKAENGKYAVVDVGAAKAAKDYDLAKGDRVTVGGRVFRVLDRPVLVADTVNVNGESHRVNRRP